MSCSPLGWSEFQSTLPTRGSDCGKNARKGADADFNPRSPRGGATRSNYRGTHFWTISIHAPHEGERLVCSSNCTNTIRISIHAPHEGERQESNALTIDKDLFQSTLPTRGSDVKVVRVIVNSKEFQSTLPTRGSDDVQADKYRRLMQISIHAPHEGERLNRCHQRPICLHFNPRSPRGGATFALSASYVPSIDFNPRSPRGGATLL